MFQKNHVRKQGLEHVHVPVPFLFPVNPEHGQHWETNTRRKLPSNDSAMAIKNIRKNFSFALVIPHISLNSFDQSHLIFSFFFRVSRVFILERCRVGGRLFVVFCLGPLLTDCRTSDHKFFGRFAGSKPGAAPPSLFAPFVGPAYIARVRLTFRVLRF